MTLRLNGSTSGYTEIDAPAVGGNNTLRLPTSNGAEGNVLQVDSTGQLQWRDGAFGTRNRIINGDMRIDQRNAGASVSFASGDGNYCLDRWRLQRQGAGTMTVQQVTSAPTGFTNAIKFTVTGTSSPSASDFYTFGQLIEGFNTADLAWGTASAQSITLSFWINSSVTGTYSASVYNWTAGTNAYPATFTVSAANTWEYKNITIPGATAGTWSTNNLGSVYFRIDLGSGSNFSGTANAWNTAGQFRTSGSVNFISNASATLTVTGVQLEAGSVATPFERRSYGQELALCQRYAYVTVGSCSLPGYSNATTTVQQRFVYPVPMRSGPTVSVQATGSWVISNDYGADFTASTVTVGGLSTSTTTCRCQLGGFTGLTNAVVHGGLPGSGTASLLFSSEL